MNQSTANFNPAWMIAYIAMFVMFSLLVMWDDIRDIVVAIFALVIFAATGIMGQEAVKELTSLLEWN